MSTQDNKPLTQISTMSKAERSNGPRVESDDRDIVGGQMKVDTGSSNPLPKSEVELDIEYRIDNDKMAFEQFMQEKVTVMLQEPATANDIGVAEVTVNGEYVPIACGVEVDVKRTHLEVIARAKQLSVRQERVTNADGSIGFVEKASLRHTYPFSVIYDPSGRKGAEWLKKVISQPG